MRTNRNRTVGFRTTEEELDYLQKLAYSHRLNVSDFLRSRAFDTAHRQQKTA